MNNPKGETYSAAPGVKGPIVLVEDHGWMQTDQAAQNQAVVDATRPHPEAAEKAQADTSVTMDVVAHTG